MGGRLVLHGATRACATRPGTEKKGYHSSKPHPPTWCSVGQESLGQRRGVEHVASWPHRQPAPSPQCAVRALWAVGWFSTGRRARGPRATELDRNGYDGSEPHLPTWCGVRQEKARPTAWGGARCELAAQTTAPSPQRAVRAPWAVGWFSTGRRARRPRTTGPERTDYDGSKPHPPTWCGVGQENPWPTAWVGARCELAAQTTAPSPQRAVRAPWAAGWFAT